MHRLYVKLRKNLIYYHNSHKENELNCKPELYKRNDGKFLFDVVESFVRAVSNFKLSFPKSCDLGFLMRVG